MRCARHVRRRSGTSAPLCLTLAWRKREIWAEADAARVAPTVPLHWGLGGGDSGTGGRGRGVTRAKRCWDAAATTVAATSQQQGQQQQPVTVDGPLPRRMSTVGSFPDMGPPPAHCAQGSHTLQARCFLLQCSASVAFLRLDRVVRVATNAGILVAHTSPAQDGGSGSRTVAPAVLHTQSRQERIPRKEGGRYM